MSKRIFPVGLVIFIVFAAIFLIQPVQPNFTAYVDDCVLNVAATSHTSPSFSFPVSLYPNGGGETEWLAYGESVRGQVVKSEDGKYRAITQWMKYDTVDENLLRTNPLRYDAQIISSEVIEIPIPDNCFAN